MALDALLFQIAGLFFPFMMIYAVVSDTLTMTIANRVSLLIVGVFPVLALMAGLSVETIGLHFLVGLACLVVTFAMFAFGWMGGGDAKLIAAIAVWFGPTALFMDFVLLFSVLGGALSILLLIARSRLAPVTGIAFLDRLLLPRGSIPYGVALGIAAMIVYLDTPFVALGAGSIAILT